MSEALARQLRATGIRDERVLAAMADIPRSHFVPASLHGDAEADRPLPIGHGQTISQPYIVALMTEWLHLAGAERVLEIGTGSGYQTAILARLAREVFSVEIIPELADRAAAALAAGGVTNVHLRVGDGARGWPEAAPFDRVIVTAAPARLPDPLLAQLAPGGRLVAPVGADAERQLLHLVVKGPGGELEARQILPVRFVPLVSTDPTPRA
jgi:protein-L-isoaspartate(D-aspartate) O-methyltransferase